MKTEKKSVYEAPFTKKTQIEVEAGICAGSKVSIQPAKDKPNVEVDDYASVENDVTFE